MNLEKKKSEIHRKNNNNNKNNSLARSSLHPYILNISVTKSYIYTHSGPVCVLAFFPFSFSLPNFVHRFQCRLESSRGRTEIQDAWMQKVKRRESMPMTRNKPCHWRVLLSMDAK